jgi:phosphoesterase RecJ-like protein
MINDLDQAIRQRFNSAQRILIASHVRPDGDAVGSVLGLGLALQQSGKTVQMVLADGVPSNFKHLPGSNLIKHHSEGEFDLMVVVDCSDRERVGGALNGCLPDLNVDHHITNLNYAKLNLVEPEAVATSSILTQHLPEWGYVISPEIATALLTGLISDTLGFRTANITPQSLRQAASLMERGADLPDLYQRALVSRSFEAARYWGAGLSRLQRDECLIWTSLTLADREAMNYPGNDDADLVNVLSTIDEVDIAVIFVEQKGGRVKISWRSQPGFDVSQIALSFGGGGHAAASGVELNGSIDEIQNNVLQATRSLLRKKFSSK